MTMDTTDLEMEHQENPDDTIPQENPENQEKKLETDFLGEDFDELTDNIYEAIIVIAKRARSIGESQKKEIDRQIGTLDLTETPEDDLFDEDEVQPEFYHYEKPTIIAMREMKNRQLKYEYRK